MDNCNKMSDSEKAEYNRQMMIQMSNMSGMEGNGFGNMNGLQAGFGDINGGFNNNGNAANDIAAIQQQTNPFGPNTHNNNDQQLQQQTLQLVEQQRIAMNMMMAQQNNGGSGNPELSVLTGAFAQTPFQAGNNNSSSSSSNNSSSNDEGNSNWL